jgi:hypothetical protein
MIGGPEVAVEIVIDATCVLGILGASGDFPLRG